jgi:hypothetical protein
MTGAGQPGPAPNRTPAKRKACQLAKYLRSERPNYLKEVFRHLRDELGVEVTTGPAVGWLARSAQSRWQSSPTARSGAARSRDGASQAHNYRGGLPGLRAPA